MNGEEIKSAFAQLAPRVALVAMREFRLAHEDAVDAVQHAYLRLFAPLRAGDPRRFETSLDLFRYMLGAVRSYASHQRERTRLREEAESLLWIALTPEAAADPETELLTKEQSVRLWDAIGKLNEPYRSIFTLLVGKEMPLADIARQLGVSTNAIYTQYARGMRHLRKLFVAGVRKRAPHGH